MWVSHKPLEKSLSLGGKADRAQGLADAFIGTPGAGA